MSQTVYSIRGESITDKGGGDEPELQIAGKARSRQETAGANTLKQMVAGTEGGPQEQRGDR